jgi:hypothetical protein
MTFNSPVLRAGSDPCPTSGARAGTILLTKPFGKEARGDRWELTGNCPSPVPWSPHFQWTREPTAHPGIRPLARYASLALGPARVTLRWRSARWIPATRRMVGVDHKIPCRGNLLTERFRLRKDVVDEPSARSERLEPAGRRRWPRWWRR